MEFLRSRASDLTWIMTLISDVLQSVIIISTDLQSLSNECYLMTTDLLLACSNDIYHYDLELYLGI